MVLIPQTNSNKIFIATLVAIQFHTVLCPEAQRKGMVLTMDQKVIILIDTGIDKSAFEDCIVGGIHFFAEDHCIRCDEDFDDDNGHGTACAYIIKSIFPSAKFYVIKALDKHSETIYPVLEAALMHCLDVEYNVINLSMTILDGKTTKELESLCKQLQFSGKIVLSSVCNGCKESYPASYRSIIGVRGGRFYSSGNYWFDSGRRIQCIADLTPCLTDRSLDKYFLFGGNSKACALMSGLVLKTANMSSCILDFEDISVILESQAERHDWEEREINISSQPLLLQEGLCIDKVLLNDIRQILGSIGCITSNALRNNDNLFAMGVLHPKNTRVFILKLEEYLGFRIPDSHITYDTLCSLNMIGKMVKDIHDEKD